MSKDVFIASSSNLSQSSKALFSEFSHALQANGLTVTDAYTKECHLVAFNHISSSRFQPTFGPNRRSKAFLIRLEPYAVAPYQYSQKVTQRYDDVFTLGALDAGSEHYFPWPYYFEKNPLNPKNETSLPQIDSIDPEILLRQWKERTIGLSLIASNKVSPTLQSNYAVRREIVHNMPEIQVYGHLWGEALSKLIKHRVSVAWNSLRNGYIPSIRSIYGHLHWRYPHAKGLVPDKRITGNQSRFSLVIENDNNYFSEKLIDAIAVGSIPIFIGGSLSASSIPSGIAKEGLSSVEEIRDFIASINDDEVLRILVEGRKFLSSQIFRDMHLGPTVYRKLADMITERILG